MYSKPSLSIGIIVVFVFFYLLQTPAQADILVEQDATIFGRVTMITKDAVSIARGCKNSDVIAIPVGRLKSIHFGTECQPRSFTPPTSGLNPCEQQRQSIFKIYFKDGSPEIYASTILLGKDKKLHLILAKEQGLVHGTLDKVKSILRLPICPTAIPDEQKWPKELCYDAPQWAVNFSTEPVYNNAIFARAFPIYVDVVKATAKTASAASFPEVAATQEAFSRAITYWTSLLLKHQVKLEPELKTYLNSIIRKSASMTLLVPPQVVQMNCPESALLVLKYYQKRAAIFPESEKRDPYIAKAQLQGRTILLNGLDYRFKFEPNVKKELPLGEVNLVTVFTHEIGHCFGLQDVYEAVASIMNADYLGAVRTTVEPTEYDALTFFEILRKKIKGSSPGEFNPTECAGLRPRHKSMGGRSS